MITQLPRDLYELEQCAHFVLWIARDDNDFFRPGIEDAASEFQFNKDQMAIIDTNASPDLKAEIEKSFANFSEPDIAEAMISGFWDPIVKSAQLLLSANTQKAEEQSHFKKIAAALLLESIQTGVSNMRLMLNYAQHQDDDIEDHTDEFSAFDMFEDMPARQIFHVLMKGFAPQLSAIIRKEFNMTPEELDLFIHKIRTRWASNPEDTMTDVTMMRSLEPVAWMKASASGMNPLSEPQF